MREKKLGREHGVKRPRVPKPPKGPLGPRVASAFHRYFVAIVWCFAWVGIGALAAVIGSLLIVSLLLSLLSVGMFVLPPVMALQRAFAGLPRRLTEAVLSRPVLSALSVPTEQTLAGRSQQIVTAAATWRTLAWDALSILIAIPCALLAIVPAANIRMARAAARLTASMLGPRSSTPATPAPPSHGHGLVGMGERVAMLGGELHTGPTPDGGFEVWARLPLGDLAGESMDVAAHLEDPAPARTQGEPRTEEAAASDPPGATPPTE